MNGNTYCKGQPKVGSFSMPRQKVTHLLRIYSEGYSRRQIMILHSH
nr:MAG TPA: hypothetical protein [Caudoviricetes sp.]